MAGLRQRRQDDQAVELDRSRCVHYPVTQEELAVAVSKDGQTIVRGWTNHQAWHVKSGTEIRMLTGHNGEVKALAFSPDGKQLLSGSKDGTIKTWMLGKPKLREH